MRHKVVPDSQPCWPVPISSECHIRTLFPPATSVLEQLVSEPECNPMGLLNKQSGNNWLAPVCKLQPCSVHVRRCMACNGVNVVLYQCGCVTTNASRKTLWSSKVMFERGSADVYISHGQCQRLLGSMCIIVAMHKAHLRWSTQGSEGHVPGHHAL